MLVQAVHDGACWFKQYMMVHVQLVHAVHDGACWFKQCMMVHVGSCSA